MARACNKENMLIFIEALESGDFEQGRLHLNRDAQYCCLGVACEVARTNGAKLDVQKRSNFDATYTRYDSNGSVLPDSVADWLGLEDEWDDQGKRLNWRCNPELSGRSATWWNDHGGANFMAIAHLFRHEYIKEA